MSIPRTTRRRYNGELLEMTIADDVAREWYGASEDLYLHELEWCRSHIVPGSTVVDCGAHHGLMTILFSRWAGPRGKVIAYELLPDNVSVLRANLELNSAKNVTVRSVGLGDRNERRAIAINNGNAVVLEEREAHGVEIVRLDDDLDPSINVDFLKIDVEGSDLGMLRGAARIIRQRPLIDLELHNFLFQDRMGTIERIFDILPAKQWQFKVLPHVNDTAAIAIDDAIDLKWLARFDNPHVFCRFRETAARRFLRRLMG